MPNATTAPTAWFVTGCSTGLGRALALRVLEGGQRCVATARDRASLGDLAARFPATALTLSLDVTDDAARRAALAQAEAAFGGIDVLVNNAGHGYLAAIEEGDEDIIRDMFETNFFALAAIVRAALPGMRARRRGHIVNISSIGGLEANHGSGYYSASKFAVEGLSQALAKEVEPHGIRVTLIEPGPFRTDFNGRSMKTAKFPLDAYADSVGKRRAQMLASSGRQAGDPVRAADAIIAIVASDQPPLHVQFGRAAVDRARGKFRDMLRSTDEWEAVGVATDFPAP